MCAVQKSRLMETPLSMVLKAAASHAVGVGVVAHAEAGMSPALPYCGPSGACERERPEWRWEDRCIEGCCIGAHSPTEECGCSLSGSQGVKINAIC